VVGASLAGVSWRFIDPNGKVLMLEHRETHSTPLSYTPPIPQTLHQNNGFKRIETHFLTNKITICRYVFQDPKNGINNLVPTHQFKLITCG
jgi:hypothetical protein